MNNKFISQLATIGITLNDTQKFQFEKYFELLVEWNEKMNLTSITEKEEVYTKHFLDSIYLHECTQLKDQKILDVGSGAGFPSIPLKIVYPSLDITIIDALQKRISFLTTLTNELNIQATLIHGRAEEHKHRESYDIATARAVANLTMLSELCIPFVKVNGYFISMKGPTYKDELAMSKNAIDTLGARVDNIIEYNVDDNTRSLLVIKKIRKTPYKYPRNFGKIKNKPL